MTNQNTKPNRLRLMANKVCAEKLQKTKQEADQQVDAFYQTMSTVAGQGLYCGEYGGHLGELAREILQKEGVTLKDHGEGVCNAWHATWK